MGREEITITVDQPDPLLQPDDEAASKKKNKQKKKKEKKERRKSRGDADVVISHPDYDSFRDMADVIKDPQERASMLGSRPAVDPAAQLPTGRVKRMFTIIGRKGERRKDSLPGSHRERWELIDPEALRKAPLPQALTIGSEGVERRSTAPPSPGCVLLPRPPPLLSPPPLPSSSAPAASSLAASTSAVVHDSTLNPPPLPPLPAHLQRHQSTPFQRRLAPPKPPPEADLPSATTSTTSTATLPAGASYPQASDEVVMCVASYNFKAQQPSELSFNEGDIIEVLDQKKSDWWMGQLGGQCGLFPRIFVNLCTPPTPQRELDEDDDGLHTPKSPPPRHAQFSSPLSSPPPSLIFGTAPLPPTAACEPPLDEVWAELREVAPVPSPIVIDASPMTAQAVIIRSDSEESAMSPHVLLSSPAPSPPQSQSSQAPDPPGTLYSTDSYSSPLSSPAASPSSSLSDLPSLIAAPLAQHQPRKTVSASPSLASFPPAPGLLDGASSAITSASAPTLPALEPSTYSPSSPAVPLSPASSASASRSSSVTTSPAATPSTSTTPSPSTSPRLSTASAMPATQPSVGASSPAVPLRSSAPAATPATPDSPPLATKPGPFVMRVAQASNLPAAGSTAPGSPTPTPGNSKVAALSQSFSAAAATFAGASSASSGPPLSASTSGGGAPSTSTLVQERRKMLFGASAAPSSPMPSPVPPARTGGGQANFISQSFAALPSPAVVKLAAPTSVSLKTLPAVQQPKANLNKLSKPTATPAHSFAALAKTIGHSASSGTAKSSSHPAIPSWVHPSPVGPSSHSAPLSPLHSPSPTSPSSSPTSRSPLSTSPQGTASGGTTRKFKEGAPIILSRKNKDGAPMRSATFNSPPQAPHFDAAMMSGASTTTASDAAGALSPENSPARARRNTSDAPPPSLAAVFAPPTRSVMSTEVADGAATTSVTVVKTSSPPATIAKPVAVARGRAKVRTRTPQPLGGGKLSQSTAAAPLPEQQQTAVSADGVPVAPTAELAEA